VVELRGFEPLTPCMPCSFGLLPYPRSAACALPSRLLRVTMSVRWIPLVPAAYGTWVARPAGTTIVHTWRRGLPARPEGEGTSPVTTASWARARRAPGRSGTMPSTSPGSCRPEPRVHSGGPEQGLLCLQVLDCIALFRRLADGPVGTFREHRVRSRSVTDASALQSEFRDGAAE
jgi:hypothetical protein